MEVLWKKHPASVSEVIERLPADVSLAYSTVITTLRILESKGYVRHQKEGRAFLYEPLVEREQASQNAVGHLLRRFFEGSPERLFLSLLKAKKISAKELRRLRQLIEKGGE